MTQKLTNSLFWCISKGRKSTADGSTSFTCNGAHFFARLHKLGLVHK